MRNGGDILAGLMAGAILGATSGLAVTTDTKENPYQVIADRNVFGLKEPPAPEAPKVEAPPAATNIKLTGITTMLSTKKVLLLLQEQGKQESYVLSEGQREGSIEVVSIDEQARSVKIKNAGVPATLTFDTHGIKAVAVAPPAAPPGGMPPPPGLPGRPTGAVPPPPQTSANLGTASAHTGITTTGGGPTGGSNVDYATANAGLKNIPQRNVRVGGSAPLPDPTPQPQPQLSVEEQIILMEINRERASDPAIKILIPPTPLTPDITPQQ